MVCPGVVCEGAAGTVGTGVQSHSVLPGAAYLLREIICCNLFMFLEIGVIKNWIHRECRVSKFLQLI